MYWAVGDATLIYWITVRVQMKHKQLAYCLNVDAALAKWCIVLL